MNTLYDITTQNNMQIYPSTFGSGKKHFSISDIISSIETMNNIMRNADNYFSVEQSVNEFDSANKILDEKSDAANKNKMKSIITGAFSGASVCLTGFSTLGASSFQYGFKRGIGNKWYKPLHNTSKDSYLAGLKAHHNLSTELYKAKYGHGSEVGSVEQIESQLANHALSFEKDHGYNLLEGAKHQNLHALGQHVDLVSGGLTPVGEFAAINAASGASADERQAELDGTFERFFGKDAESFSSKARAISQQTMQAIESLVSVIGKLQDAMALK